MIPAQAPGPRADSRRAAQASELLPLGDWVRHHSLRSWPVLLFLALICAPSIALVILGANPSATTFDDVAWIFAAYFAVAWLLLLGIIVRPEHVTRLMLVVVAAIALVTQVPLALALESALHATTSNLGRSIIDIGVPEELAKALPVLAAALIYRRRHGLEPRDYLFLGAVSGLAFGASEVVRYFTVNGVVQFYVTLQSVIPSLQRLLASGVSAPTSLFAVLIAPVRFFVLDFVWRFVTDPISHACWSGLSGYFIGLAVTGRHKWYKVAWIGLAAAAVLHGLNDWSQVNGHWGWILVTLVSGLLFLGYAKVGCRGDLSHPEAGAPAFLLPHGPVAGHAPRQPGSPRPGTTAGPVPGPLDGQPVPAAPTGTRPARPWWEH